MLLHACCFLRFNRLNHLFTNLKEEEDESLMKNHRENDRSSLLGFCSLVKAKGAEKKHWNEKNRRKTKTYVNKSCQRIRNFHHVQINRMIVLFSIRTQLKQTKISLFFSSIIDMSKISADRNREKQIDVLVEINLPQDVDRDETSNNHYG